MSINILSTQMEFAVLHGNQFSDPVGLWRVQAPERFSLGGYGHTGWLWKEFRHGEVEKLQQSE